ncbi:MAG: sulfatase [Planctomycetaceae bacterium]
MLHALVCAAALLPAREVVRADSARAIWHQNSTWNIDAQPDRYDRVLIPGSVDASAAVVAAYGSTIYRAATLMVGRTSRSNGVLEVHGDIRVAGPNRDGETQAGRLYVGGVDATGTVLQYPGSDVYVSKALRLGYQVRSTATYVVQNSIFRARQGLSIAFAETARAEFHVVGGQCSVKTNSLQIGAGDAALVFESDTSGFSPIEVTKNAVLAGTLRVQFDPETPLRDEYVLLEFGSRVSRVGGFRRVLIDTPHDVHYELTYTGGNGNDVAIVRRDAPLTRFETWQQQVLASSAAGAMDDPDADDLENLGEYKLGCSPLVHEGLYCIEGTTESGSPFIEFTERKDRSDVQAVAQMSVDGRVWNADGLTRQVISQFGNTETVRVTATDDSQSVRFRLLFERLPDSGTKPHVLFIMIDDLNDWIEPLGGHPQAITPNLNALAARSVLFANAHCAAPVCHASRTAILMGVAPHRSGIYENPYRMRDSALLASQPTIPEQFAANGYTSVGAGKLFQRSQADVWTDYYPSLTQHRPDEPGPPERLNGISGRGKQFDWGPIDVPDTDMGDYKVASWVIERLASTKNSEPTFIGCGFFRPHLPFYVPPAWFSDWNASEIQKPILKVNDLNDVPFAAYTHNTVFDHDAVLQAGQWNRGIHAYLASIRFADAQLGRVLDALHNSEMARNTIVVLSSDHGWHFGSKQTWRKFSLWEESTRTPLAICAPGITTPGTRCDEFVSLLDIYPTLVELAGLSVPPNLDGTSLVPQLSNPDMVRLEPVLTTRAPDAHSLRRGRWRLSRYADGSMELYDHHVDPNEWTNLANDATYSDVIEELSVHFPTESAQPPE